MLSLSQEANANLNRHMADAPNRVRDTREQPVRVEHLQRWYDSMALQVPSVVLLASIRTGIELFTALMQMMLHEPNCCE